MNVDLRAREIVFIPTHGKSRGRYHLEVWIEAAKTSNVPYFMILDKGAEKEAKKFTIDETLIPEENLFLLKRGAIEDYYPLDKLVDAIKHEYGIEVTEEEKERIAQIPRTENIEKLLKEKVKDTRGWKVRIGKKVAESMTADEIDDEIKRIIERIATKIRIT